MAKMAPPINGATIMSEILVNSELINKNFELSVIQVSFINKIEEYGVFSFTKIFNAMAYCFTLIKKLIFFRPKLVYFTLSKSGIPFIRDIFYVMIIKFFGPKIIFHLHGRGINEITQKNKLTELLYKFAFKKEEVIVLSKNLISDVKNVHIKKPFVIMNGVKDYFPNFSSITRNKTSTPILLFLSTIAEEKGAFDFIDALSIVNNDGYNFIANIVGSPSRNTSKKKFTDYLIKKKLDSKVNYKGPKYGNDKYEEFKKANIFVFPSHIESFGLVAVEAMQFKLPVIASNEGSLPIIVKNGVTGLLAEPKNVLDFAEKIKKLMDDRSLCLKMGKNGRRRFREYFTDDIYEENILKVFNKCLIN